MRTIVLSKGRHKGKEVILLQFPFDRQLGNEVRKIKDLRWSKSLRTWHVPYSAETLAVIKNALQPHAIIDEAPLRAQLEKKSRRGLHQNPLLPETEEQLSRFVAWMNSRRYSPATIRTYTEAIRIFLRQYPTRPLNELNNEDIISFNNDYILAHKLSSSFQNQVINAIKLFFQILRQSRVDITLVHRPKRSKTLPNVLSKEEVKAILDAHRNIKHKVMLSLIYSCGLRCGELLALKPEHIDSSRRILIIKQAKGRKDRIAPLSSKIDLLVKEYIALYSPVVYLFEGRKKGTPYDARSLQLVLKQGLTKTGISKPVSLHWLRHSYATHLLENGTDLRYIQEILGHSSSKTTEIYTHVSTKNIQQIVSPYDYL